MDKAVGLVVQTVMKEARERAGSAERLNRRMDEKLRRSKSAISAYVKGDSMPPADVFLEAARVTDVHLDDHLYGESLASAFQRMKAELEEMKQSRGGEPRRR